MPIPRATERQLAYMQHVGIDIPEDCTVREASKLITQYRQENPEWDEPMTEDY